MSIGRPLLVVATTTVAMLALRTSSLTPLSARRPAESMVRLSWSARPERIETCRRLSDAELAALPAHMRLRWSCEGHHASYLLTVRIDDRIAVQDTVRGGGLRHDRSLHVFTEVPVTAGPHRLAVVLARIDSSSTVDSVGATPTDASASDRERREAQERRVRRAEALPARLALDTTTTAMPGRVLLVSYSDVQRSLSLRRDRP